MHLSPRDEWQRKIEAAIGATDIGDPPVE